MNPKCAKRRKINVIASLAAYMDQLVGLYPHRIEGRKWSQKAPRFSFPSTPGHCCLWYFPLKQGTNLPYMVILIYPFSVSHTDSKGIRYTNVSGVWSYV